MKNNYIGLMAEDSSTLLAGVLAILKSGNCFVPINTLFPSHRIKFIIEDCQIEILITDKANLEKAREIAKIIPTLRHIICIDELLAEKSNEKISVVLPGSDIKASYCYVIYTSGSTGKPKGIPITHRNILPLFYYSQGYLGLGVKTRVLQNLSYTFDFGVFEILTTLLFGGCLFILDKFLKSDFYYYPQYINSRQINTIHTTPIFLNNLAEQGQKMPSLMLFHLGGEQLTASVVIKIMKLISPHARLYNGYGPTEASINCTYFVMNQDNIAAITSHNIPIGHPSDQHELYILDKHSNPQPVGTAGELCIGGPGLTNGYLNRPELTAEKFRPLIKLMPQISLMKNKNNALRADFHHSAFITQHSMLYCTGDLARWLPDGPPAGGAAKGIIEFLGRIDHQVKIRGFRIELDEIETCLSLYPAIKEAALLVKEHNNGTKYLCAYVVIRPREVLITSQLREFLLKRLPDYMVPAYFIALEKMPLNTNGKLDRKALQEIGDGFIASGVEYRAPETEIETKLAVIWQNLLGLPKIGIDEDFFEAGGDSIQVNRCLAHIREELQVEIPLRKFFEKPFIKALAEEIVKKERQVDSIKPVAQRDEMGRIPLSFAQERLWFLQELDAGNVAYFVPRVIRITGNLEPLLIERTFTEIIRRHEILRTVFPTVEGQPVQRIKPPFLFKIPYLDWSNLEKNEQELNVTQFLSEEDHRAFDFEKGPLLRVTIIKLKVDEHLFVLTEHHLIHDGWTQGVLLKEFIAIFSAYIENKEHRLGPLPIQYADFAIWQRQHLTGEVLERHLCYWQERLIGLAPFLELPSDRPRPPVISGKGELQIVRMTGAETARLKEFSRKHGVTLFMTMLAVFKTLLYRYTGVEDLCVGTGMANRRYKEIEGMLGMVINTLPLRTKVEGEISFKECLNRIKETCLESYQHEDTPFGKIVERLQQERNLSYTPLFQVLFSFMDTPGEQLRLPGLELELLPTHNRSAKFDINIVVAPPLDEEDENAETLVEWEYNTDIFNASTIQRWISHYNRLLDEGLNQPGIILANLPLLSENEIKQVLYEFNNTETSYPRDKTIQQLFAEQAAQTPDYIALHGCMIARMDGGMDAWMDDARMHGGMDAWMHGGMDARMHGGMDAWMDDAWMHGEVETLRATSLQYQYQITYRQLDEQSNRLAVSLIEKGALPDDIVGIMMERSIDLITAILGILKAGGAYLPIDPGYPQERIDYMLKDSKAKLTINSEFLKEMPQASHQHSAFIIQHSNFSYIMYTSGSTGQPKGVVVTHRNVVRLVKNTNFVPLNKDTKILQTGAPVFDATTFEIWGSLLNGGQLMLVNKEVILDAQQLKPALIKHRVNTLWLSAPLFNQLQQQDNELFVSLHYLLVGGDILSAEHINPVKKRFPGLKIINGYGPTENTTFSTTYEINKEYFESIPIGKPIANSTAYILDKAGNLVPVGIWGELVVGGAGVSLGYLNNPELTAEKFRPLIKLMPQMSLMKNKNNALRADLNVFGEEKIFQHSVFILNGRPRRGLHHSAFITQHSNLYCTGDLARWLPDGPPAGGGSGGVIEFKGRIDQQVKIRGFRIELGEIEERLRKHSQVKDAVVIDRKGNADKLLYAYIIPKDTHNVPGINELKTFLQESLPDYMIPSYFIFIGKIPLNPNGKVDRKALPEAETGEAAKEYTAPRDEIEKKLVEIWADLLNPPSAISIDDNFFDLGGHSLNATLLTARMHKAFNVKIPLKEFFQRGCIREIAEYLRKAVKEEFAVIEPIEKKEYYPLSTAQKRMVVLSQLDEAGISYNIPAVMTLEGDLDRNHLENVFSKLIQRHEILRTSFTTINEEPVQIIHKQAAFKLEYHHSAYDVPEFIRSFDLAKAPLLRVALVEKEPGKYLLMIDMHHIVTDGTSMELFIKEFIAFYGGEELPPLKLQYKDYSAWQLNEPKKTHEEYWLKQFSEMPPLLNLPLDYPRPVVQCFEGRAFPFEISGKESSTLKTLAAKEGVTLFTMLLSVYYIFLAKLTGQEDIVVGTPVGGRSHAELEPIMGIFVNTLALRNNPHGEKHFSEFLKEINQNTLAALSNQDYPYEELVEKVILTRDTGRNPLFDTLLNLRNMELSEIRIPGLIIKPFPYEENISKFDLSLRIYEGPEKLRFTFEYCTRLFKPETIARFAGFFKAVAGQVTQQPHILIAGIEIIPGEEKQKILDTFNNTVVDYPHDKTIQQLFAEQAAQTPDYIALHGCMDAWMHDCMDAWMHGEVETLRATSLQYQYQITYRQLNDQSDRLAGMLIEKGVLPDDIIAIMMERSIEMITGILGILKSGTAYLPIDPQSPPDRIQYILKDSAAAILVIDDDEKKKKINCQLTIVNYQLSMSFSPHSLSGIQYSNLAYIIYTSGSTGKPKGVPITHANVTPLLLWGHHRLGIGTNDRTMQNLACHFDWSVWEIFITLITGAILNIVSNELLLSGSEGASYFKRHNITILHATPTQYQLIISSGNKFETLKYLFLGAEKLSLELLKHSLVSVQQDCRVFNMYGPTEAAIISAVLEMKSNHVAEFTNLSSVPIGQPVANGRLLILDNDWHICPMNIMGELYIGGGGVAPGYLNNPELTAERFKRNVISQWSFVNGKFQRNDNSLKFSNDQCPMTNDRLYKTGDLARWLTNGNIEFLGRIDHQVKIRGFRIELGEIESRLAKHKTVRDVVVINQSLNGDQYLCAYIVPLEPAGFEKEELRNYLAGQLPHYMVPAYWVSLEKIPLNANGKINLRALPQPDYVSESVFEPPANETENMLAAIWSDILGIEKIKVSVHDNFFRLGGHSLKATIMLARIQKSFAVKLSMAQIFNFPTIQKLAGIIAKTGKKFQYDLEPIEKKEYYELSYNQKRLWIINQWDPQGTAFNMPGTIPLNHNADITSIKKTLQCISERHESLKTAFIIVANEPVQYIAQKIDVPFEIKDLSLLPDKEKQLTRQQLYLEISTAPFELETPPLFRTRLVKLNPDHYELMYNIHHIIADGWSLEILQKEFSLIYESYRLEKPIEMEPLLVQYKDFAAWHNKHLNCINDVSYQSWKNKLIQEVPILKLPADFTNNPNDKRGASYRCLIDTESTDRLKKLARLNNTSPFMVMFSIYTILISRFSRQEDISCSIIAAGREHAALQNIIGFYVNSIIFTTRVDEKMPFIDILTRTQSDILEIFQHQDYPLELICDELKIKYPKIPISFNMLNFDHGMSMAGQKMIPFEPMHLPSTQEAKFDIELYVKEYKNTFITEWSYRKAMFQPDTIEYLGSEYLRLANYFTLHADKNYQEYKATKKKRSLKRTNKE